MRKKIVIALIVVLVGIVPFISSKTTSYGPKELTKDIVIQSPTDLPLGEIKEYEVQPGDTFAEVMENMGIPYSDTLSILNSSKDIFDFTKINTGKLLKLVFVNRAFAAMEYNLNSDTVIHVKKENDSFKTTEEEIPYVVENVAVHGVITDSLFIAAQEVGMEDKVTLELADVFSSDIDFSTDIREGDTFSIVYEKRSLDGKSAPAGKVLAAKFTNDGKTYTAFRYNNKFYNENGESLARQFLKSPLSYARISSGFSYKRTNPVTKQITPHRAIDYAAGAGTPVIATANGKVTTAGSKGDLGITVELKTGNYLTQYAHLSSIAKGVKKGVDVAQGDVVGYVGSTGVSTGPHLQYAMFKNGNPINPLTADFSRGESIGNSEMGEFKTVRGRFEKLLN